jgi:phenylpropionate dioxygenase-like ring-hydroxylating dioxygenase large terminal subunit
MFLRNCWYVAAEAHEVARVPLGRVLLGEPVVFYRREDGTAVALEDRCCHRRAPLHKGRLEGDNLRCGYHGFVFAPTGACVAVPGYDRLPFRNEGVRAYPLVERDGYLWIWMGAVADADPALIPDFHWNVAPGWTFTGERLPIAANYFLLVENLIDLSHVAFVHATTIGSDDSSATLEHERGERSVKVIRAAKNIPTPPHMRRLGLAEHADMTKVIAFTPASSITIDIVWEERDPPAGRAPGSMRAVIINSITPETERSCHYFWGHVRDFDIANADMTAFFHRIVATAFSEDKDILEAQQCTIEIDPLAPTLNVNGDWGGVQARRMVDALIAQEQPRVIAAQ